MKQEGFGTSEGLVASRSELATLTKGVLSDVPACARILSDSDLGERYFPTEERSAVAIEEFVGTGGFLVVRGQGGDVAGFVCHMPTGAFHAFPYLHLLAIAGSERGKGVGTRTMDLFEREVAKGSDKLFLVVADFNPRARDFYSRRGYQEVGRIPSLYREGIDERLMMKRLLRTSMECRSATRERNDP